MNVIHSNEYNYTRSVDRKVSFTIDQMKIMESNKKSEYPCSKNALLCIHGYMGSPRQFEGWLAQLKERSWDVYNLCLPGHHTDVAGFAATNPTVWLAAVQEKLSRLAEQYESIVIWTHSMGGLLAVAAASEQPQRVKGIVAVAFPLKLTPSLRGIRIAVRSLLVKKKSDDPVIRAAQELRGVSNVTLGNVVRLLPNALRVRNLIPGIKEKLPHLGVPLHVVFSQIDETVPAAAIDILAELRPDIRPLILQKSSHFWYAPEETLLLIRQMDEVMAAAKVE